MSVDKSQKSFVREMGQREKDQRNKFGKISVSEVVRQPKLGGRLGGGKGMLGAIMNGMKDDSYR